MRRDPGEVLDRARILSLLSIVEDGMYMDTIPSFVDELDLERSLTDDERAWLSGEAELSVEDGYQIEAMLVMAWSLHLVDQLGDRDPEVYGPVLCLLQNLEPVPPEDLVNERHENELREMLSFLEALAIRGEDAPPNERFGAECLRWRRAALRWLLDPGMAWPPSA